MYMLGSTEPITFEPDAIRQVLERPGVLEDISGAYDSPARTIEGWTSRIAADTWLTGDAVREFAGSGPMVTDDRPVSEYFLLRSAFGESSPVAVPSTLREAAEGSGE
jgi:hypothetical protein